MIGPGRSGIESHQWPTADATWQALYLQSPHAYVMSRRMDAAKRSLVNEPERSVADIAVSCGFASAAHFSRCFKQALGTTPTRWRQQ